MIKRTLKILGIIFLIFLLFTFITMFFLFSNYKKLENVQLKNEFITDTIPFTFSNSGHILIDVKMEGDIKSHPFILDSGASNLIFSNHINEFDLENDGRGFGIGSKGNFFFTKIKKIDQLLIGNMNFGNVYAKEVDFDFDCMENIYGIIGTGLMHHFDWQIDFVNKIIIVSQNLENLSFGNFKIELPLTENRFSHHLKTSFKLRENKIPIEVLIDLGSNSTVNLQEEIITKDTLPFIFKNIQGVGSEGLGDEKNENSTEKFYLVDSLFFENANYKIEQLPILTSPKGINLIGLGFFKKYKTTISWSENKLILEPYNGNPNFIWKTSGFASNYDEKSGKIIITAITDGTTASKEKLPIQGEILSINNVDVSNKKTYCSFFSFEYPNDTIKLKVKYKKLVKEYLLIKEPIF